MIGELIRVGKEEIRTKGLLTEEERKHVARMKKISTITKDDIEFYLLKRDHIITS